VNGIAAREGPIAGYLAGEASCPHLLAYSDFATVDAPLAVVVLMVTPFMYHFWHIVVGTLCGHKKCVAHFMHGGAGWRSS
jgi:hypothetical protein